MVHAALPFVAGAVAWTAPALAPVWPPMARALGVPRTRPGAAEPLLTFDDGPHLEGTPAVLDRLTRPAVFFLMGEQVRRTPALAREIVDRGHRVGVHADRHRNLLRVTPRGFADDLDRAHDAIATATGVDATLYRPPYGILSAATLREVRRRGWLPLLWSRWGRDWARGATPAGIARTVVGDGLRPEDVVLLHDSDAYSAPGSWRATVGALGLIPG